MPQGAFRDTENVQTSSAALNGVALSGGCSLAAACDYRIACDSIKMRLPEVGLGIMTGAGGIEIITKLIGLSSTRELIFTGSLIDANKAFEIKLVGKVVPRDEFVNTVDEFAKSLAEKSAASLILSKMAMGRAAGLISESSIPYDTIGFSLCSSTEEKKILMDNFLSKRKK